MSCWLYIVLLLFLLSRFCLQMYACSGQWPKSDWIKTLNFEHKGHHLCTFNSYIIQHCWKERFVKDANKLMKRVNENKKHNSYTSIPAYVYIHKWISEMNRSETVNSLRPSDAYMRQEIKRHWSAPSHYLNQCWNIVIGHSRTNFSEILIEIHTFSFKKMHFKMSSAKWRLFHLGLNVLMMIEDMWLQCIDNDGWRDVTPVHWQWWLKRYDSSALTKSTL